ncbi:MAG: hypothetical protein ACOX47_12010 [Bacillota bacterium]|jgi:glycosyltransferase involved in cell wall biosynthesis
MGHNVVCINNDWQKDESIEKYYDSKIIAHNLTGSLIEKKLRQKQADSICNWYIRLGSLVNCTRYPNCRPGITRKLVRKAEEIKKKFDYDVVIGVFRPYDNIAEIMFRVFMTMLEIYPDLVLHLFVKGNCNEVIEQYSKKSQGRIVNHGIVPHKELIEWLERSDVLINISNNMESVVPSKIFELFATGKKILNFVYRDDDYALKYYRKYPLIYNIIGNDVKLKELCDFSFSSYQRINFSDIEKLYPENTPLHVARIIESIFIK